MKRGKNDGLQAAVPAETLESRYLPSGQLLIKKQTVRRVLVALPHSHGVEVLSDEDRVVIMCASDRN